MRHRAGASHTEESESYLETFLDVLLCGFGAALALMIVYSVLPKGGSGLERSAVMSPFVGGRPVPGLGGKDLDGQPAVPVVLVNAVLESSSPSSVMPVPGAFQLLAAAGGELGAQTLTTFQNLPKAGSTIGWESLFRIDKMTRDVVLLVSPAILREANQRIHVKIIFNSAVADYSVTVVRRGTPAAPLYEVRSVNFSRHEAFSASSAFVPLLKLTTDGQIIGWARALR